MTPNPPDPERLREAARELAASGLTARDVDEALRVPPGFSRGLLAADDSARFGASSEKTAA